jgi:phosphoribosylglycinamide formyltransferase-1
MVKKIKVAILISGRGSNMKALIDACKDINFPAEIAMVISNKHDALGLNYAQQNNILTAIIDHKKFYSRQQFEEAIDREITKCGIDIICLAGFMRVLSPWFVEKFQGRLINIHPSLLPEFKGANAVADALNSGAKISGCTTHFVSVDVDSGEIIMQAQVDILSNDDFNSLAQKILVQEHIIYPQTLKKICKKILQ